MAPPGRTSLATSLAGSLTGNWTRSLPAVIADETLRARPRDEVLTIRVPKSVAAKPRWIAITS